MNIRDGPVRGRIYRATYVYTYVRTYVRKYVHMYVRVSKVLHRVAPKIASEIGLWYYRVVEQEGTNHKRICYVLRV